jgi:hypothetical protein
MTITYLTNLEFTDHNAIEHILYAYRGPYQLLNLAKILRWTMCLSPDSIQNIWGSCLMAMSDLRRSDLQAAAAGCSRGEASRTHHRWHHAERSWLLLLDLSSSQGALTPESHCQRCVSIWGTYSLRGCFRLSEMPWTSGCQLLNWWTIQRSHLLSRTLRQLAALTVEFWQEIHVDDINVLRGLQTRLVYKVNHNSH